MGRQTVKFHLRNAMIIRHIQSMSQKAIPVVVVGWRSSVMLGSLAPVWVAQVI